MDSRKVKRVSCSTSVATRLTCGKERKAATGDVQLQPRQLSGKNQKITDWDKFRAFANEHGDKTQVEMAQLWEGDISDRTISRALAYVGFTRKKKLGRYRERDEAKRTEFLAQLGDPKASHLVYVDESGMDERDNYGYGWSKAGERFLDLKSGRRQGRVNMIAGYP